MLGIQAPVRLERTPSRAEDVIAAGMGADKFGNVVHGAAVTDPDLTVDATAIVLTNLCCRNVGKAGDLESGAGGGRFGWGWERFGEGDIAVGLQGLFIECGGLVQSAVMALMEFMDGCDGC